MKKTKKNFLDYLFLFILIFSLAFAFQNGSNVILVHGQNGYPPPGITPTPTHGIIPLSIYKMYIPQVQTSTSIGRSYYIEKLDHMYDLGYRRGVDDANSSTPIGDVVILDFGDPQKYAGPNNTTIYGVLLYDYQTYLQMPDVIYAVQQYVNGYIAGSANNRSSTLTVIVGTNSSGIWVNHDTGQAWAQMIFGTIGNPGLQYWAAHLQYNNNPQHVYIAGGIDIESGKGDPNAGWRSPSFVNQWLSGYASTYNSDNIFHLLYYFGNAAGCQVDYPPTDPITQPNVSPGNCDTVIYPEGTFTWTQEDIWDFPYNVPVVGSVPNIYPIPQIYSTYKDANSPNGYNAEQWYRIALYSELKHNKNMYFSGVLTQQMACSQKSNCSQDTKNSSADAFSQLANQLFSDPYGRTTGVGLNYYWRTDIGYFEGDPN